MDVEIEGSAREDGRRFPPEIPASLVSAPAGGRKVRPCYGLRRLSELNFKARSAQLTQVQHPWGRSVEAKKLKQKFPVK